jgi:ABC-type spermidine/putrescine transport system permease subunit II
MGCRSGVVVYCVPYMLLVVSARLAEFDVAVEDAARDLGATPFQVFRLITFPLIWPTIIGGMLLIFAQSFDMFVITFFNIGAQSTLPMVIWSMVRLGINPSLNALGAMVWGSRSWSPRGPPARGRQGGWLTRNDNAEVAAARGRRSAAG